MTSVICTEAKEDDYLIHLRYCRAQFPTSMLLSLGLLSSANFILHNKTETDWERVLCHRACLHIGHWFQLKLYGYLKEGVSF